MAAAVVSEIENMNLWFPYVKKSKVVYQKDPHKYHAVTTFTQRFPFINIREWFTERLLHLDNELGFAVLEFSSINSHLSPIINDLIVPPEKGMVRAEIRTGGIYCESTSPHTTYVCCVFNVDLKVKVVPEWLLNSLSKDVILKAFNNVERCASKPLYQELLKNNPQLYEPLKEVRLIGEAMYKKRHGDPTPTKKKDRGKEGMKAFKRSSLPYINSQIML
eukprot:GHVL01031159.1.p1 GENE.GHVL01031159.1~~GHVL01031159.1.p1  ORF type:complete len:219 (+),score=31.73 GHVL01031159.1:644-1300(+)